MLTNWFRKFLITVADKGNLQFTLTIAVKVDHKNKPRAYLVRFSSKPEILRSESGIWSIDPVSSPSIILTSQVIK